VACASRELAPSLLVRKPISHLGWHSGMAGKKRPQTFALIFRGYGWVFARQISHKRLLRKPATKTRSMFYEALNKSFLYISNIDTLMCNIQAFTKCRGCVLKK
jgi:hypothetical protein